MVSSPCAVMPKGSETAVPMVLEPTSNPRTRGLSSRAEPLSGSMEELYGADSQQHRGQAVAGRAECAQPSAARSGGSASAPAAKRLGAARHGARDDLRHLQFCRRNIGGDSGFRADRVRSGTVGGYSSAPRIPRAIAAGLAVVLLLAALLGVIYFGFNQASNLVDQLPKYAATIRAEISTLTSKQ